MLSILPTPVGHRDDITVRSLHLITEATHIFCEQIDTTKKLLQLHQIVYHNKKFVIFNSFIDEEAMDVLAPVLMTHEVVLMSECGTPGLSDPAKSLIKYCREHDIKFQVLPGATALIPAVVSAYTDTSSFTFLGFLPKKKGRAAIIQSIMASQIPVFIYESVHRISQTLLEFQKNGFVWQVFVSREISKLFEQHVHGTIEELLLMIWDHRLTLKGEFVLGFKSVITKPSSQKYPQAPKDLSLLE